MVGVLTRRWDPTGFDHEAITVSKDKEALKQLKWVHVLTANMKGNLRGVYHGVSEKHLG